MVPAVRKISALKIISVVLVFTVSFFAGKFAADWGIAGDPQKDSVSVTQSGENELPVNRLNVLLLGIDARTGEKDARTDSMMLVSIDRDTKKIAMVSIPRDTMVEIDGHGTGKINTANVYGGADLARQTVEKLLGLEIPYYVKTNFNGFKEIIDVLGGVNIDVEKRMYYPSENINLKPGTQRLDGYKALGYVRFRHDALGDIGRTERQQKFLTALAKEMLRPASIIKAPILVPKLMDAVETNLGVGDAILVAKAASSMDANNIMTATLPGVFYNYKGASYWKVDDSKAKLVLSDLFSGVRVATISGPDINVPVDKPAKRRTQEQAGGLVGQPADLNQNKGGETTGTGDTGMPGTDQQGDAANNGTGPYPGQDQGGYYPGQEQPGQYPGQNQGSQTPGQNQNGQTNTGQTNTGQNGTGQSNTGQTNTGQTNTGQTGTGQTNTGQTGTGQTGTGQTNTGQTNTGQTSGTVKPLNKPGVPVTQPVQTPTGDTGTGQTKPVGTTGGPVTQG